MKDINLSQMIRYLLLAVLLGQLTVGAVVMPLVNLVYYFTNWTLFITIFSVFYSIRAVNNKELLKSMNFIATHHILYSFAICFNLVTVSVYWSLIHQGNM